MPFIRITLDVDASLISPSAFVEAPDTIFAIPTYRLRDVPETVERYDENFWLNGNEVALIVFDDSSLVNHHKYYAQLEATRTANPLYYVGPREKEQFIQILLHRLREPKLEGPVRNLFRPSYGGNRNFTLMYSLGAFLVSSDDDMRPNCARSAGQPRKRGSRHRYVDRPGDEHDDDLFARKLAHPLPGKSSRQSSGQDCADVPDRHERY